MQDYYFTEEGNEDMLKELVVEHGAVATAGPLAFATGALVSVSLGNEKCLGNGDLWPVLLAMNGITGIVQAMVLVFVPESPKYLLLTTKDKDAGRKALRRLRNGTEKDIDLEVDTILASNTASQESGTLDDKYTFIKN